MPAKETNYRVSASVTGYLSPERRGGDTYCRQAPTFTVRATGFGEAKQKAIDILVSASTFGAAGVASIDGGIVGKEGYRGFNLDRIWE